jgi:hypothetical protein
LSLKCDLLVSKFDYNGWGGVNLCRYAECVNMNANGDVSSPTRAGGGRASTDATAPATPSLPKTDAEKASIVGRAGHLSPRHFAGKTLLVDDSSMVQDVTNLTPSGSGSDNPSVTTPVGDSRYVPCN